MNITFYTVTKKRNSTLRPAGGVLYSGQLTAPSGVLSPSVLMQWGEADPGYNYAYISEFGRYYWIREKTAQGGGLWRVDMTVDVLASYKTAIGAAEKYVLRSAAEFDGLIQDSRYPTKAGYTRNVLSYNSGWPLGAAAGSYVVGVVDANGTFGSVSVYCLDEAQFTVLRQTIAPSAYYANIGDVDLKNLAVSVVNPMQYIAWVRYYPFSLPQGASVTMQLGNIPVPNMPLLASVVKQDTFSFTLSAHPQATRGAYLNTDPYTIRYFSWLPVGMIHIPPFAAGIEDNELDVFYVVDVVSGTGELIMRDRTKYQQEIYRTCFVCGVEIPVAQIVTSNPIKIISGSVNLLSAGLSALGGNIGGVISNGISGIANFIGSQVGEVQAYRQGAGSLLTDPQAKIVEFFAELTDERNDEFGRPLCKTRTLGNLPGFIMCADEEIELPGATESELAEVGGYLTGGFYYE